MATSLKNWLTEEVQKSTLKASEYIFKGVVKRSPVFTGGFQASWRMREGSEDFSVSVHPGKDEFVFGNTPLSPAEIPKLSFAKGKLPTVYITNQTPYGGDLEDGTSTQAPGGIVRPTLAIYNG